MFGPGFYGPSLVSLIAGSGGSGSGNNTVTVQDERLREGRRFARMGNEQVRVLLKSHQQRAASLAGGGSREVARRARQIAAGKLQVST